MTGAEVRPGYTLGVDLGTSHTVAMMRWPDGRTRPLLFDGQPLLPSAVFLDQGGRLHVGRDAQRLGQADPARLEPHPKRHIDAESVLLAGTSVAVADLFAALLGGVAQVAVATAGFLPPAVLTYPASWGARRRAILTEALGKAGWPAGTRLVAEPVAAARYFTDVLRRPVPVGSAVAVFDFGGGTLDVAVVRNEGHQPDGQPRFEVAASGGADDLGGLDLDSSLVDQLGSGLSSAESRVWAELTDPATLAQWRARRQFWDDVRGAKEMLSRSAQAPVPVPGVEHALHLTRDELERQADPLIRRGVAEAEAVIKAAGLAPADLAGLFLVGGSTRVPMVSRLLHAELGIQPTALEQPELPVAEGAIVVALAAGAVAPRADESPATSVAPAALGTTPAASGAALPPTTTGSAVSPSSGPPSSGPPSSGPPSPSSHQPSPPAVSSTAASSGGTHYAEPVDPWATGEAAAYAAANGDPFAGPSTPTRNPTPTPQPWLASQEGDLPAAGGLHTPPPPTHTPTPHTPSPHTPQHGHTPTPTPPHGYAPTPAQGHTPTPTHGHTPTPTPGHNSAPGFSHTPPPTHAPAPPPLSGAGTTSGAATPRRRKMWVWITAAAAAVVVLGAGAALAVVFWPSYRALDFQTFRSFPATVIQPGKPMSSGFSDADLVAGRAYFAYTVDDTGPLSIISVDAVSGDKLWESDKAGIEARWEQLIAVPHGAVAISAIDSERGDRSMVMLSERNGDLLWQKNIQPQDGVLFVGEQLVLDDTHTEALVGFDAATGTELWSLPNPEGSSSGEVVFMTTTKDHSGPADATGSAFDPDLNDDTRLVQVTSDKKFRVVDPAQNGKVVADFRPGLASPTDEMIGINNRFVVVNSSNNDTLMAYDLSGAAEPVNLYTAADDIEISELKACGAEQVCWLETKGYDDATTHVAGMNIVDGGTVWRAAAPEADTLVSVGDAVLVSTDSPAAVTLVRHGGEVLWTEKGVAGRLDAGNMLRFNAGLSTVADDPAVEGIHVGDEPVQLGSLSGVRSSTCAWNTSVIACVRDRDFVVQQFAG